MKKVFKYQLKPENLQVIEIPGNPISVEVQREEIVVYALADEDGPIYRYEFATFGTGHEISVPIDSYTFLGTARIYSGTLMFHVFYRRL